MRLPHRSPARRSSSSAARLSALLSVLLTLVTPLLIGSPARASEPEGVWPLDPEPEVVQGFDPPADPFGPGHRGVDLAGHVGQAVRTVLPGEVRFAGGLAGRGVVVVGHGARRTTYEPVAATVSVGDRLGAGAVIGRLEAVRSHCFPAACLHWGLREGETYLDPLSLVGDPGRVRLLPLTRDRPVEPGAGRTSAPLSYLAPLPYAAWRPLALVLAHIGRLDETAAPQARGWAWR